MVALTIKPASSQGLVAPMNLQKGNFLGPAAPNLAGGGLTSCSWVATPLLQGAATNDQVQRADAEPCLSIYEHLFPGGHNTTTAVCLSSRHMTRGSDPLRQLTIDDLDYIDRFSRSDRVAPDRHNQPVAAPDRDRSDHGSAPIQQRSSEFAPVRRGYASGQPVLQ